MAKRRDAMVRDSEYVAKSHGMTVGQLPVRHGKSTPAEKRMTGRRGVRARARARRMAQPAGGKITNSP